MTTDTLRDSAAVVVSNASAWAQQVAARDGIPKRVRECASGVAYQLELAGVAVAKLQAAHDADKARIAVLEAAAMEARRVIRLDRESLFECHRDPKTGDVIDQPGIDGLREYDDALSLLDAALTTQASEVE